MHDKSLLLLNEAQQKTYVDAIFAMAALDGFEVVGTTGNEHGDRPVTCAKQIGRYCVEISWSDEADHGPDATKPVWEVEVNERDLGLADGLRVHLIHTALQAIDALKIAKGLTRFHHALTRRSGTDTGVGVAAITSQLRR